MPQPQDPLISIAAAAREIGVDRTTLSRQVANGSVRSHDGKVRLSEVLEDRASNIDLSRGKRREGRLDELPTGSPPPPGVEPEDEDEDGAEGDGGTIEVDGVDMSYAAARTMKETYLAKLKKLDFDTRHGQLAPVAAMATFVEREYSTIRERLLAIPGKLSGELEPDQVERLTEEIHEALEELSDPRNAIIDADQLSDEAGDEEDDPEAPAPPEPRRMGRAVPLRRAKDQRRSR